MLLLPLCRRGVVRPRAEQECPVLAVPSLVMVSLRSCAAKMSEPAPRPHDRGQREQYHGLQAKPRLVLTIAVSSRVTGDRSHTGSLQLADSQAGQPFKQGQNRPQSIPPCYAHTAKSVFTWHASLLPLACSQSMCKWLD
jgi:hypothetical protein